ncbi:three component ABC system middle component [Mucilaginibacter celer]|uniref:Uncharacterized protein n=1 Tax=Mucilaginibacter celer TaxID=2305508 RepID=A0A494VSS1_9SPHI|nr:three component ABC system middle component [Mucilaginibacter celer]AYL97994.1 hypothetical protein HYN43_023075 [Mucilaginibacter celer]
MNQTSATINNNEALASLAVGYLLKVYGTISAAKVMLILPFILHPPTVRKLRGSSLKRSLEEFIVKSPECFISFNARFNDYLPLSVNAVTILQEMNIISIVRDQITYNHASNFSPEYSSHVGKRADDFFVAINTLADLFRDQNENSLYLKLKIEL